MALGTSLSIVAGYTDAYRLYIRLAGSYPYIDYDIY
jgi:uncharacterized membrane protein YoaK (UPF0700 family)